MKIKKVIIGFFLLTLTNFLFSQKTKIAFDKQSKVILDLPYNKNQAQKLDIYLPKNSNSNTKVIFFVHGGGWFLGNKDEAVHWAKYFQNREYAVVCLNYRLIHTEEKNVLSTQITDINSAINFTLHKAKEWNISNSKLIIMGASAGGQLALLYAYKYNNDKKIKAAISFCGATDLTDKRLIQAEFAGYKMGTIIKWLIGDTITNNPTAWKVASPINCISKTSIPTFFLHGKADEIIPYQQSARAYTVLKSFGINSQLELLENVPHDLLSVDLTEQLSKADKFIRKNVF